MAELQDIQIEGSANNVFKVPKSWKFIKKVGSGAYGSVASFEVPKSWKFIKKVGEDGGAATKVAVKKVSNAYDDLVDAKRIVREVKLLRNFHHENIICILDMLPPPQIDCDDIYIVTDLMETGTVFDST